MSIGVDENEIIEVFIAQQNEEDEMLNEAWKYLSEEQRWKEIPEREAYPVLTGIWSENSYFAKWATFRCLF